MKPLIRLAKKEDFASLFNLESICFKEETFNKKQLRYLLLEAKSLVLVAESEKDIIGSIIVLLRPGISNLRIYSLNIHPAYRRRGIGSKLMDEAEDFAKKNGFKEISLEVGTNNKAAQELYRKKGFLVDRLLKKYYKNGDDAFRLFKKINFPTIFELQRQTNMRI